MHGDQEDLPPKQESEELIRVASKSQDRQKLGTLWYDFACVAASAGLRADALEHLRRAVENGFANADHMTQDEDLKSLRGDAKFAAIVEMARKNAPMSAAK